jgi:hypothetical protein
MALSLLVARSNQSPLGGHNTVATSIFLPSARDLLLADPLLLSHPQVWEHQVSLFDKGIDSGTFMAQNYGLDVNVTQSQLTQYYLHLPQIDSDCNGEPPLPYNNKATIPVSIIVYPQSALPLVLSFQSCISARTPTEISQEGGSIPTGWAPELDISHDAPFNAPLHITRSPGMSPAVPSQPRLPHDTPVPEGRSYDRPGKKPAAPFQPDPLTLEEFCRRAGGSAFAVDWIISTFKYGVTTDALLRVLGRKEINEMKFPGGFEPHQAYDGFISKVGERYECGLCREGNRTRWKHKKDAPRHLRKFHFGLADVCKAW